MLNKRAIIGFTILVALQVFVGCSSVKDSEQKVSDKKEELFFIESDSEIIADSVVKKILNKKWNSQFSFKRKPKIIVGAIIDSTNEKIDVELLSKNIERSFINSGEITFITSKQRREEVRYNRKNLNDFVDNDKFRKYLKQLKSDFFISGTILVEIDSTTSSIRKKYNLILDVINNKNTSLIYSQSAIVLK